MSYRGIRLQREHRISILRGEDPVGNVIQTQTTSRLWAWWLKTFRGYSVTCVKHRPQRTLFGGIVYKSLWLLERPLTEEL